MRQIIQMKNGNGNFNVRFYSAFKFISINDFFFVITIFYNFKATLVWPVLQGIHSKKKHSINYHLQMSPCLVCVTVRVGGWLTVSASACVFLSAVSCISMCRWMDSAPPWAHRGHSPAAVGAGGGRLAWGDPPPITLRWPLSTGDRCRGPGLTCLHLLAVSPISAFGLRVGFNDV